MTTLQVQVDSPLGPFTPGAPDGPSLPREPGGPEDTHTHTHTHTHTFKPCPLNSVQAVFLNLAVTISQNVLTQV